ncbi:MAG TPA: NUDIX hydrolase [Candidatus Saccharimonadales bacterium]
MDTTRPHGTVLHTESSSRKTDYLYRISLKCLIRNAAGEVLVVKETGRDWWDLPGGGMDHGEDIRTALARETFEEVGLRGEFSYRIIDVDEPALLEAHNFWQLRLIFEIIPENMNFDGGEDGDEIAFMDPSIFKESASKTEQRIYRYANLEF